MNTNVTNAITSFVVTHVGERILPKEIQPIIPQIPTVLASVRQVFDDTIEREEKYNLDNNKQDSSFVPAKYNIQKVNMSDILQDSKRKAAQQQQQQKKKKKLKQNSASCNETKKKKMVTEEEMNLIVNKYVDIIYDLQKQVEYLTANRTIRKK
jgi:hypothetical protein